MAAKELAAKKAADKAALKARKQAAKQALKMKKLDMQGPTYGQRKMEANRQRNKTLRVTAIANAMAQAYGNRQTALNNWNQLINGEALKGGQQSGSVTDSTKGASDKGEAEEKYS